MDHKKENYAMIMMYMVLIIMRGKNFFGAEKYK